MNKACVFGFAVVFTAVDVGVVGGVVVVVVVVPCCFVVFADFQLLFDVTLHPWLGAEHGCSDTHAPTGPTTPKQI